MTSLCRGASCVLALALLFPSVASPWGATGHRVVALVAATLLTPAAQSQVATLLGPGVPLADVADWADAIRPTRPQTGLWHYVNIPREATGYDAARDCPRGCIITALHHFLSVLADPQQDRAARQEALRWVVHLMADLHQPLHAVDDHDHGGNDVPVRFFGLPSNLHRVWDSEIIDRTYADPGALQVQMLAAINAADRRRWEAGGPEDWAEETHLVAVEAVYLFPTSREIDDRYMEKALPVIHEQLAKAAVRLAWVLNRAFTGN